MTRMISVLGATALAFSVLACGDKDDVTDDTSSPDDTSAPDDTSDPDDTADPDDTSDPDDTGEIQYGALMDYTLYEGVEGPDVSGGCTQRIGGVGEASVARRSARTAPTPGPSPSTPERPASAGTTPRKSARFRTSMKRP